MVNSVSRTFGGEGKAHRFSTVSTNRPEVRNMMAGHHDGGIRLSEK